MNKQLNELIESDLKMRLKFLIEDQGANNDLKADVVGDIINIFKQQKQLSVTETLEKVKEMIEKVSPNQNVDHDNIDEIKANWARQAYQKEILQQLSQLNIKKEE